VAAWLLWELHRRPLTTFAWPLWRAPVVIALVNFLLPVPFVLVNGTARELFAEQGGEMALRLLVRILVGFGYVALMVSSGSNSGRGACYRPPSNLSLPRSTLPRCVVGSESTKITSRGHL
jgi:hypothetical protein